MKNVAWAAFRTTPCAVRESSCTLSTEKGELSLKTKKITHMHDTNVLFLLVFGLAFLRVSAAGESLLEPTAANFEVAEVFSEHMVIQQNEPIVIYGTSTDEGGVVVARFGDAFASGTVENGAWRIEFNPTCSGPQTYTLEVYGAPSAGHVVFEDVIVGDVYLVIGQSNVEYSVSTLPAEQIPEPDGIWEERVRLLSYNTSDLNKALAAEEFDSKSEDAPRPARRMKSWHRASHGENLNDSALGYCFGQRLCSLGMGDVPIGVISLGFGGMELRSFVQPELAETLTGYGEISQVYNHFIEPLLPFAVRGVIWYQGEANAPYYLEYADSMTEFLTQFREDKAQKTYTDFPYYIVELPPCFSAPSEELAATWQFVDFGLVRAAAGILPSKVDNTYICVTSDLWSDRTYANNLHPNNKPSVASRLAGMAASVAWNASGFENTLAPTVRSVEPVDEEGRVYDICFDHVAGALQWNGDPKGFYGVDLGWNALDVTVEIIDTDRIRVTATDLLYRIGYGSDPDNVFGEKTTLCSGSGIPAAAFYADVRERIVTRRMRFEVFVLKAMGWINWYRYQLCAGVAAVAAVIGILVYKLKKKKKRKDKEEKTA